MAEPDFAFLDHAASALSDTRRAELYERLAKTPITYICVEDHEPAVSDDHDTRLELREGGGWNLRAESGAA